MGTIQQVLLVDDVARPVTTWNPSDKAASITLSGGNLTATKGGANSYGSVRSTSGADIPVYAEVAVSVGSTSPFMFAGVANLSASLTAECGRDANGWGYYQETGAKYHNNSLTAFGAVWSVNAVIGIAYNPVTGKLWFAMDGTWQAGGDPTADTNPAFSGLPSGLYIMASLFRGSAPAHVLFGRFKQSDLFYTPPIGFVPWGS